MESAEARTISGSRSADSDRADYLFEESTLLNDHHQAAAIVEFGREIEAR